MAEDDSDDWKEFHQMMKARRQERHASWKELNTRVLQESGLPFMCANQGESLLFRQFAKPMVDFYPSTGRWRVVGKDGAKKDAMRGGAKAFLGWYNKQTG